MLVAGLALLGGWALDIAALKSLLPGLATMTVNTALGLGGAGAASWLLVEDAGTWRRRVGLACAALPAAVGVLTLTEYAFDRSLGIDEWLIADPASRAVGAPPGRPAPNTALALLLLGLALLGLDYETRRGRRAAEVFAIAAGLIAFIGLLGYAYSGRSLYYAVELYSSMALHTAALILGLALGILCARPRRGLMALVTSDSAGGYVARRLLPAALLVPPIMGGLRLVGERAEYYGFEFGLALFATSNVVVFAVLVWWNARSLHGLDTRRRQAEERLRLQGAALEAAANAIVIADREGRIVWVNPAFARNTGYTLEEVRGQNPRILKSGKQDQAFYRNLWETILAGRVWQGEIVNRRKDGGLYNEEMTVTPVRDVTGEIAHFVAIKQDVTERKRAEAALRESEERFRMLTESALTGVYLIQDDRFRYVNPALALIFGYPAGELAGKLGPLDLTAPEDRALVAENVRRRVVGEAHDIRYAFRGLRRDGKLVDVEVHGARVEYNGKPAIVGTLLDVTERKRAEEEVRRLNAGLERRVAERTAQLEATNKEIEAFSYSVSHDLRAPLRAIDGFSRILLAEHAAGLNDAGRDYLGRVRRAAQHMAALIDDLLKLSRVTRAELARERVDLSALAHEIVEALRRQDPQRNVRCDIAPGLEARADPRLLRVALENLLGNAWKFTGRQAEPLIELGAQAGDAGTVYFVRDNGAGFDMAYADKLFGAFQRLHDAGDFPGTGIGLATVQRIVHKHGGRIWAEGAVDRGATFYFTLTEEGDRWTKR